MKKSKLDVEIADEYSKGKVKVMQEISKVNESLHEDPLSTQIKASRYSTQVAQSEHYDTISKQQSHILF